MSFLLPEASQESFGSAQRKPQQGAPRGNANQHFDVLDPPPGGSRSASRGSQEALRGPARPIISSTKAQPAPKGPPRKPQEAPPDSLQNHVPGSLPGDMHVPPSARCFPRKLWERPTNGPRRRPQGEREPTFPRLWPYRGPQTAPGGLPEAPKKPREAPGSPQEVPRGPEGTPGSQRPSRGSQEAP